MSPTSSLQRVGEQMKWKALAWSRGVPSMSGAVRRFFGVRYLKARWDGSWGLV
jgi:hypothetical protein